MNTIRSFIKWWNRPNKSVLAEYVQAFVVIVPIAFVIRTWVYGLYKVPSGSMETTLLIGESFVSDKFTYSFLRKPQRGEIIAFNEPEKAGKFRYSTSTVMNWVQRHVWGPENWTKRIIGLPGEHIEGKVEDGRPVVYINGQKLDEPYVNKYPLIPTGDGTSMRSYDPAYSYECQPFYRMNGLKEQQLRRLFEREGIPFETMPGTVMLGGGGSDIFDVHLKTKEYDGVDEYWVMGDNRLGSGDSRAWGPLDGKLIHGKIVSRLFSVGSDYSWIIIDFLLHPIDCLKRMRWSRWFQFVS